jgi:acyl carrier protein phosphodiesterase
MNYLAHIYLAHGHPEIEIGGFLGDFVRGREMEHFPEGVRRGIELHRKIDAFTDEHPAFRASRARVSATRRRFAGIMVDMFYDHFLARNWDVVGNGPLEEFTGRTYRRLRTHSGLLPETVRNVLPRMEAEDWLASYREVRSIGTALDRIGTRLKRPNTLAGSVVELEADYEGFASDFAEFLPAVRGFAAGFLEENGYSRGSA